MKGLDYETCDIMDVWIFTLSSPVHHQFFKQFSFGGDKYKVSGQQQAFDRNPETMVL